jgi:uncharacterized repeat protein (TIGR02543 family)
MKKRNIIFFSTLVLIYLVAALTISNVNGSYAASKFSYKSTECISLYEGYVLIYNTNGGDKLENTSVCAECDSIRQSYLPTPIKSGYNFEGWYYDTALTKKVNGEKINDVIETGHFDTDGCYFYDKSINLYAKWIQIETKIDCPTIEGGSFELIYETNGGSKLGSTTVCRGCGTYSDLPVPTKSGYTFGGWYYDSTFMTKVEGNSTSDIKEIGHYDSNGCYSYDKSITLYAHWKANTKKEEKTNKSSSSKKCNTEVNNKYTLTYQVSEQQNVTKEICVGCDDNPAIINLERNGYVFAGWYYDTALTKKVESEKTSDIKVSKKYDKNNCHIGYKDVTLYPKWVEKSICEEAKTLTISFDTLGGSNIEDIKITSEEFTIFKINPEIPTKENYIFEGWYYDSELTNKVDTNSLTLNNNADCEDTKITLYAKYKSIDTAILKGKIVNSNKAALTYTKVSLDDEIETLTDDNGYYELENVSDGNHDLIIKDINDNVISKATISILNQIEQSVDEYTLTYTKDASMISANIKIDKTGNIEFVKTDTKSINSLIIVIGLIIIVIMAIIISQNNVKSKED